MAEIYFDEMKIYNDNKTAMVTSELYETLTIAQGILRMVFSEVHPQSPQRQDCLHFY